MQTLFMKPFYDSIYLSPHLDDAALSCGGQIFAQTTAGQSVLVVTVMAGDVPDGELSDFAAELHARWELGSEVTAVRRAEDAAACAVLGADFAHWDVPDCVYRRSAATGQPLYPTWPDVIGAVHLDEAILIERLTENIIGLPDYGRLIAPLGVGRHADHQVTRLAAEQAAGGKLIYYEDYPYVAEAGALTAVIPDSDPHWQLTVIPLQEEDLAAKVEAIAAFVSQMSTFFEGHNDLVAQINAYAQQVGGERLWHRMTAN